MGYRCPVCSEDFDRDRSAWAEHIKATHAGDASQIAQSFLDMADDDLVSDTANVEKEN